jgi:hypothetical protein
VDATDDDITHINRIKIANRRNNLNIETTIDNYKKKYSLDSWYDINSIDDLDDFKKY